MQRVISSDWKIALETFLRDSGRNRTHTTSQLHQILMNLWRANRMAEAHRVIQWADVPLQVTLWDHKHVWETYLEAFKRSTTATTSSSPARREAKRRSSEGKLALSVEPQRLYDTTKLDVVRKYFDSSCAALSPLHLPHSVLTATSLLQYSVSVGRWEVAARAFLCSPHPPPRSAEASSLTLQALSELLLGSHWRQWSLIVVAACPQRIWDDIMMHSSHHTTALLFSGQWVQALQHVSSSTSEVRAISVVKAAVRAGVWKAAFLCHKPYHIAETVEDLPLEISVPLITVLGPRWRNIGKRLLLSLREDIPNPVHPDAKRERLARNLEVLMVCEGGPLSEKIEALRPTTARTTHVNPTPRLVSATLVPKFF